MTGIELLVGAIMPVLIEFFVKYIKNTNGKFIVSLVLPLLAGIALNYNNLSVEDIDKILGSGAIIFATAQTIYKTYFRDSALQKRLNA